MRRTPLDTPAEGERVADVAIVKCVRELDIRVVHAGHEPSFGRERMIELVDAYLAQRG